MNKYGRNKSKVCVLELEYPKELRGFHDDYHLVPDKIEIQRKMLSNYQLKTAEFYNVFIGIVKKLVPNFFDKEMNILLYENLKLYSRLGLI